MYTDEPAGLAAGAAIKITEGVICACGGLCIHQTDELLHSTKARQYGEAGLLACNIFAVLPIPGLPGQWTMMGKNHLVTYSCGTACDFNTIPY